MAAITKGLIAERLLEEINAKEDLSLRLGDALDVKASIGLAIILFIATQSAYLLDKGLPPIGVWMQFASIGSIALAAAFSIYELWPRMYILPEPESSVITDRVAELQSHYDAYPNAERNVADALLEDEMYWAKKRIADNQKKNRRKSDSLNCSFWLTIPAIALNIIGTMLMLIKN